MQKIAKESAEYNEPEEDDDAQYYRDEVGEEPDEGKKNMNTCLLKYVYRSFLCLSSLDLFSLIMVQYNLFYFRSV